MFSDATGFWAAAMRSTSAAWAGPSLAIRSGICRNGSTATPSASNRVAPCNQRPLPAPLTRKIHQQHADQDAASASHSSR